MTKAMKVATQMNNRGNIIVIVLVALVVIALILFALFVER